MFDESQADYINSINVEDQPDYPGNEELESQIVSLVRWNALCLVVMANEKHSGIGGHLSTFASISVLYEVGLNHFFRASNQKQLGDLIYFQGHSSPGNYARAYLEGRINRKQMQNFRREAFLDGLSSYPHPYLMPKFWQFSTVSMGLSPIQSIYQARFLKYLNDRNLLKLTDRKVWAFCGDGEMSEPEAIGAISVAVREKLNNLIFVINCNLQQLDGLIYGNGNIVKVLAELFSGAGWKVIKVLWNSKWDELFAKDQEGWLQKRINECVDGDFQHLFAGDINYIRKNFFGKYPELKRMVFDWTDEELKMLAPGGMDCKKVFAAYKQAVEFTEGPVVILAQTVKGYGQGAEAGEAQNVSHQQRQVKLEQLLAIRNRFNIPIADEVLSRCPFCKPQTESKAIQYLKEKRKNLGGYLPSRKFKSKKLVIPRLNSFVAVTKSIKDHPISTTMAFDRILLKLLKDKLIGKYVVPIAPDEFRTFGLESMFRQYGIYSPVGQLYEPIDKSQVMSYRQAKNGQLLQEGITEAGAFCSWLAAATSYCNNNLPMIPFFIFYSMFGFQRIGDLIWAAGDMLARGFLIGAIAGRTTVLGEGLQHQDGQSQVLAATNPNCRSYDPAYAYELAAIIQHGLHEMYRKQKDVFYYLTVSNENYQHPEKLLTKKMQEGIVKGIYLLKKSKQSKLKVQLFGSGAILLEAIAAAELLTKEYSINCDIWSVTSFNELRREALFIQHWNRLHPLSKPKQSYLDKVLKNVAGPIIAASDYMKIYADQISSFIKHDYVALGTDGFGRSDTREALRSYFEVDRYAIVIAALKALADQEKIAPTIVAGAISKYQIRKLK